MGVYVCDMRMVHAFEYRVCMSVYTHAEARGGCMLGIFHQSLFSWLGTRSLFKSETLFWQGGPLPGFTYLCHTEIKYQLTSPY